MEELLATIVLYGSAGEFGRISTLLEDATQDGSFSADIRGLLRAALDLRFDEIKSGMSFLRQHTSGRLATIALFIELVYLNSCPLKDNDRIEILQKSLELDFISITLPLLFTMFAASMIFSPSSLLPFSDVIENRTEGISACCALAVLLSEDVPAKYRDRLSDYMNPCLKSLSSPVIALANITFFLKTDISALKDYLPMVTARYARMGTVLKDLQSLVLFEPSACDSVVEMYKSTLPPDTQLIDHIKQSHFPYSKINQLSALLSIACFGSESDLNSALFTAGRHVLLKDIGNVRSTQQLSAVCSFIVGMLRSCPLISVCDTLKDLLAEVLSDLKLQRTYKTPLQILKAYLSSAKALLNYVHGNEADAKTVANDALVEIKQVTERLDCSLAEISISGVDKNSMLLTLEDISILMTSLSGNHEKAVSKAHMLADLDVDVGLADLDAPASPSKLLAGEASLGAQSPQDAGRNFVSNHAAMNVILSSISSRIPDRKSLFSIIHNILPSLVAKAKNPLKNMIGVGPLHANVCYCTLFPDTLALTVLSKYVIQTLKPGQQASLALTDNEAKILTTSYSIILSLLISSPTLRLADLHLLSFLHEHQAVIKRLYTLSSLASEHGFVGLTTDELFLAATSSNAVGNPKEVQLFLSQAVLLDPSIEQTPNFASVVSKIYSARGDWSQAIKSLTTILTSKIITLKDDSLANTELLPLRTHIALLKLRLSDESGYHDLKKYLAAIDSEVKSQGKHINTLSIEPHNSNLFYIHMQLSYLLSKMTIFCLINANVTQVFNLTDASENLFTALQAEYSLSFFDCASVTADVLNALMGDDKNTAKQASSSINSFPYYGSEYGPDPFPFNEIFVNTSATNMAHSMSKSLVTSEAMSLQTALSFIKQYTKINKEIGDFVGLISLHLKNDKVAYVQHFLLDKPSEIGSEALCGNTPPSKLFSLASAYQFVGKTKESSKCLETLFTNHKKYTKSLSLKPDSGLLFYSIIATLYARSLCRIHYFLKAESMLVELVNTLLETWNKALTGYPLSYTLVFSELVRLLYRMGKEPDIAHLADATILKLTSQYQLPQTTDVSANNLPTDVVYLAVYAARCRIALKDPMPSVDDKIVKLQLAINWFTSCIIIKTGKMLTTSVKPVALIRSGIFSSKESLIHNLAMYQNTQISSPMLACRARVILAEMYLDLAHVYLESTGILTDQIIQSDVSLDPVKKGMAKNALDFTKRSIDLCENSKAYLLGAVLFSVVANDYTTANEYVNHALELPVIDSLAEEFHSQLKSKLKTEDNDDLEMDDFNADFQGYNDSVAESQDVFRSPFEQLVYRLRKDLTCDRASTLDTFLMQSCTRQDPWNLHNLLFGEDNSVEVAGIIHSDEETSNEHDKNDNGDNNDDAEDDGMMTDSRGSRALRNASSVTDAALLGSVLNSQLSQNGQNEASSLDGYWYLGLGFICIKTGRVKDGVPYLIISTRLHTLQESYKARAYFILGTTYLNSTRSPLFGYQSALTTKSTSAVAMQKMAMKLSRSGGNAEEENIDESGDGAVPTLAAIEAQEEDVNNAVKSLKELEKLSSRGVAEAASLHLALLCYIRVVEYKIIKDKISRIMLDEGKNAKSKIVPLESKKDKIKDDLEAIKDDLLSAIEEMTDTTPNIVVLLTCLGIVFTHLKNHPRARNQFKRAAGLLPSVKEIISADQMAKWLDLDAAVSANLALADLYITTGKLSNAIKSLEAVSQQDYLNAISYELYGLVMEKEASYNDACKYYESAWLLSRGASTVAFRLAYNYIKSNRYEDAVVMCQLALREWPDFTRLRKEVLYLAERRLRTSSL